MTTNQQTITKWPRGSTWNKWDLHIHTPASFSWEGQKFASMSPRQSDEACRRIIARMNEADAAAFAIMDYWTFDGYLRIRSFLNTNPEVVLEKAIFPGMELRCESPAPIRMNIHVLLSDQLTEQQLNDFRSRLMLIGVNRPLSEEALAEAFRFLSADKLREIGCKEADLETHEVRLEIGHKVALVSRDSLFDAFSAIPAESGLLFLPFDTYHGLHEIDWRKHPLLTTEFMVRADLFEARQTAVIDSCHGIRTNENDSFLDNFLKSMGGRPKPAVSGSDAHSAAKYASFPVDKLGRERCTWVKANPTFQGLRQLLNEPAGRVYVGPEPEKLKLIREHPTKFIRAIRIGKKSGASISESWFDTELLLNHDLVAIIGNKGNGKSALADIIGLLANTRNFNDFSFLTSKKFRETRQNKARHFQATIVWESGETSTRGLDENPTSGEVERVRYIPQNYLETVCNENNVREGEGFDAELKSVIFSHVPTADRLEMESLDKLISYKTKQINETISILNKQLHELNINIVMAERRLTQEHKASLEKQLEIKRAELEAHDAARPAEVTEPSADHNAQVRAEQIDLRIQEFRRQMALLDEEILRTESEQKLVTQLLAKAKAVEGELENFERIHADLVAKLQGELTELQLRPSEVLRVTVDRSAVIEKRLSLSRRLGELGHMLNSYERGSLIDRRKRYASLIEKLRMQLDEPSREYQAYVTALTAWEAARQKYVGDRETPGTLGYFEAQIEELDILPSMLDSLRSDREAKAREIYAEIERLSGIYRSVYKPVQDFSNQNPIISNRFGLNFSVSIRPSHDLSDQFFSMIQHGAVGSFCGREEGETVFKALVDRHSFEYADGAIAFAKDVLDHLTHDHRDPRRQPVSIEKQLRKGKNIESIYDFLYSFKYLEPRYSLKLGEKELPQLSPGERGMLLLVFYLLIDKDDIPLVVDQPEGNLDNQTVFQILGDCIKEAKQRRQVIVVTHNPNLAVACDADQIICASLDPKQGNRITYTCGAIEDPLINQLLLNILEGTRPAFDNREAKYFDQHIAELPT